MENNDSSSELAPAVARERETEQAPAWAMIEPGRYQPKRIRGSCLGRELG